MNNQPQFISLDKAYEVRHWTREFNCSEIDLYCAVLKVGKGLTALHEYRRTSGHCFHQLATADKSGDAKPVWQRGYVH